VSRFFSPLRYFSPHAVNLRGKLSYADMPDVILPSYAMKWSYTFENFMFNGKGVSRVCDAGEVLIGGKAPMSASSHGVTWKHLKISPE